MKDNIVDRIQYSSHPATENSLLPVVVYLIQFSPMKTDCPLKRHLTNFFFKATENKFPLNLTEDRTI